MSLSPREGSGGVSMVAAVAQHMSQGNRRADDGHHESPQHESLRLSWLRPTGAAVQAASKGSGLYSCDAGDHAALPKVGAAVGCVSAAASLASRGRWL